MSRQYKVAVAGATGAVGQQMVACLEERKFPVGELVPLASERSVGKTVTFQGKEIHVDVLNKDSFKGVDIALFSAGGSISKEYGPIAAQAGAVVVDNSSAWRMDPEVPLVVPEVNPQAIALYNKRDHRQPQLLHHPDGGGAEAPARRGPDQAGGGVHLPGGVRHRPEGHGRVGQTQVRALFSHQEVIKKVYPHRIAFNCLPHIDVFLDNGYTKEEMKMVNETRKIMGDDTIEVTATTVRVPVFYGHSESVNLETEKKLTVAEARKVLAEGPRGQGGGQPGQKRIPHADRRAGQDLTLVGRIREDFTIKNGLNLWIVADNIRKGAATNAVQIAEILNRDYIK